MRTVAFSLIVALALLLGSCGYKLGYRHFAEPIVPAADLASAEFVVGDDYSITFVRDRLEVSLLPLNALVLNRQFPVESNSPEGFIDPNPYATSFNPYTYGDWKRPGGEKTPERFTVFLLKVKNYAFPKVWVDPTQIELTAPNGRRYESLGFPALVEYYRSYAIGFAGNAYESFKERQGLLQRTLFPEDEMIFSGQETEGYVVFPVLAHDVEDFTISIKDMVLRFDYRNQPVEMIDIPYSFEREVYLARQPREN